MMRRRDILLLFPTFFVLPAALSGCGGGGRSGAQRGKATFTIRWPKQTRVIPPETKSITVKLTGVNQYTSTKTSSRPGDAQVVKVTFTSVPAGDATATATAYSGENGGGDILAIGSVNIRVRANGDDSFSLVMQQSGTGAPPPGGGGPPAGGGGANDSAFVTDVTVPDGTAFGPNDKFTKVWRIKNTGSSTWGLGYKWTFDGGQKMDGPDAIDVPNVGPGQTWDPSVELKAPGGAGRYKGYWKLQAPDGSKFGTQVYVDIKVSGGGGGGSEVVVSESDVVSEGQVGFAKIGTPRYWHDQNNLGDGGHMLWTKTNGNNVDNIGDWRPNLPETRDYEIFVFIPRNYATTRSAAYEIYHATGNGVRVINQYQYSDEWVSIGTYRFNQGSGGNIRLADRTGEPYNAEYIGYDSIKWVPR